MKAVKGNKEYTIDESQKKFYQESGFDIKDAEGKVIAYGRGKTVAYEEYMALKAENDTLKEEIASATTEPSLATKEAVEAKKEGKKAGA